MEKKLEELQKERDGFMQELVEECKTRIINGGNDGENRMKTMIEVLLDLQEKEPEYYTDRIIRSLMLVSELIPDFQIFPSRLKVRVYTSG